MNPLVSFIIPTMNEESTIQECINSLLQQNYPSECIEILVIDGGSTDKTHDILNSYGDRIWWTSDPSLNKPQARNLGLQQAHGEYIFNYNGHVVAREDLVSTVINKFANRPDVDAVGYSNLTMNTDKLGKKIGQLYQGIMAGGGTDTFKQNAIYQFDKIVDHVPFVCYKKHVVDAVGWFDNSLQYGQDHNYNIRLNKQGYKLLYTSDTVVYHQKPTSLKKLFFKMFYYGRARAKLMRKHKSRKNIIYLIPLFILSWAVFLSVITLVGFAHLDIFLSFVLLYLFGCIVSAAVVNADVLLGLVVYPIIHISYALGLLIGRYKDGE